MKAAARRPQNETAGYCRQYGESLSGIDVTGKEPK
jgi:hypothetical protein